MAIRKPRRSQTTVVLASVVLDHPFCVVVLQPVPTRPAGFGQRSGASVVFVWDIAPSRQYSRDLEKGWKMVRQAEFPVARPKVVGDRAYILGQLYGVELEIGQSGTMGSQNQGSNHVAKLAVRNIIIYGDDVNNRYFREPEEGKGAYLSQRILFLVTNTTIVLLWLSKVATSSRCAGRPLAKLRGVCSLQRSITSKDPTSDSSRSAYREQSSRIDRGGFDASVHDVRIDLPSSFLSKELRNSSRRSHAVSEDLLADNAIAS
ncbi:hypothetical protein V1477_017308 [Vespula maculifrons]|uniref:Uncharacterized protein n=1 Tax=Vespula maculifrons TaxID=7453 RepID=A0ABD2B5M8_VESMC